MCQQIPRDIHKNQNRCEAMYKDVEKLEGQMCFSKEKKRPQQRARTQKARESQLSIYCIVAGTAYET